jgi:hypothetical protein
LLGGLLLAGLLLLVARLLRIAGLIVLLLLAGLTRLLWVPRLILPLRTLLFRLRLGLLLRVLALPLILTLLGRASTRAIVLVLALRGGRTVGTVFPIAALLPGLFSVARLLVLRLLALAGGAGLATHVLGAFLIGLGVAALLSVSASHPVLRRRLLGPRCLVALLIRLRLSNDCAGSDEQRDRSRCKPIDLHGRNSSGPPSFPFAQRQPARIRSGPAMIKT